MMLRELFIFQQLKNQQLDRGNVLQGKFDMPSIDHMKQTLSVEALRQVKFEKSPDVWCQYCSNRDVVQHAMPPQNCETGKFLCLKKECMCAFRRMRKVFPIQCFYVRSNCGN